MERETPNEKDLVNLAIGGDKAAFDSLMLKYQGRIARIVSRYVSDQSKISDISQDAFLKAFNAIHHFRGDSSFYTWLYRIAINTAKNEVVNKHFRLTDIDVGTLDVEKTMYKHQINDFAAPEYGLIAQEFEMVVHKAIEHLPEKLRTAFMLREQDGLSYEAIAHIMDCPLGTVRSRLFRARKILEQEISPDLNLPPKPSPKSPSP